MGISEALGSAYVRVEDAYYSILDFFEQKGVGLPWTINDFLEQKGIPALPFTIALLAVLAGGMIYVSTSNAPQDVVFSIQLKDDKGRALEDVSVKITNSSGKILDELSASDGQTITLKNISPNEKLTISAHKQGYGEKTGTLFVGENKVRLSLQGSNDAVVGRLKLVDSETGTVITNAQVTVDWPEASVPLTSSPGSEGIVSVSVPLNEELSLTVRADNYEDLVDVITFTNGDVKVKELAPKTSAQQGSSVFLVKAIDAATKLPLENVHIKIENAQSGETISDVDVSSGTHSENLTKGLVVRVSVTKEDYAAYTSNDAYPGGITLRNEEEVLLAPLSFGGTALNVITQSESSKQPLSGVELTLLDGALERIDGQTSNFSGEAAFSGLNETNAYTLLAYSPNFFPVRKNVEWSQLPAGEDARTMVLPLTPFVSGNAGTLTVFVSEKDGKAATQAVVSVHEKENGEWIPLIASRSPDAVGSFTARLPVGMEISVRAQRGNVSAEENVTVASGLTKVVLTLEENSGIVTFLLKTKDGKPFVGNVLIKSAGGDELFSDSTTNGIIDVPARAGETITLTTSDSAGKKFTKTFSVGTESEMTIVIDAEDAIGNAPQLTFEGLVNVRGEAVPGVSSGEDVFARFTVKWPTGTSGMGGLFVRVGSDSVASVDSQFVGITGLNGDVEKASYGRSWNPSPKPGKEAKDRAASGKAGSFNKWVEALVERPAGTQTIDIRLRAREGAQDGAVDLFYRAFVQNTTQTIRTPADGELGVSSFTSAKSGLYAASASDVLSVYENLPFCQGSICATITIVDKDNRTFNVGNFRALEGELYAIQLLVQTAKTKTSVSSTAGEGLVPLGSVNGNGTSTSGSTSTGTASASVGTATIKATTNNENPLLVFTKYETGTFAALSDTGTKDTSLTFSLGGTSSQNGARARIHFLPESTGDSTIALQIISGNESFTQTIPIEIVTPNTFNVDLPESVESGEPISIRILDNVQQVPVTSALITFTDASGVFAGSMKGTNTMNKGENGVYVFSKALEAGLYSVRVSVPGYSTWENGLRVGVDSPLLLDEKIVITIPFGQTKITQNVNVTNVTKHPISAITGEIIGAEMIPDVFTITVGAIPALAAKGKGTIPITVTYSGDPSSVETKTGAAELELSGTAAVSFPVNARVPITVTYNPKLDASCLQFSKEKLSVTLLSEAQPYGNMYTGSVFNESVPYYGSGQVLNYDTYNAQGYNAYGFNNAGAYQNAETKRVNVKVKNNCGETLNLVPGITQENGESVVDGLKIAAIDSALQLTNGQEKQVDFEVSNNLFRAGFYGQPMNYFATFSSAQLVAALPFEIIFSDRSRAIQTPENVELTLIKTGNQKAVDRATISITNIGSSPIYGLNAVLSGETQNDVTMKLENVPGKIGGNDSILLPGQTLYPPLAVVAESLRDETGVLSKKISISGIIEGRKTILREVNVFARTGSSSCLNVSAFDTPVSFISSETQGSISKRIRVQNKCLEPVRVTKLETPTLGTNELNVSPVDGVEIIEMGEEKKFDLVLTKGQVFKNQFAITLNGLLVLSQKTISSNPLSIVVAIGPQELEFSQASNPVQVNVCEGGSITVRYPILAKKNECSQAYCDAEQASHMISDAIEKQLSKAVQQMQAQKNDATAFDACDVTKRYCTFAQLGISSPTINVYLQNDALTPNVLSYVMKSGPYPRLGGLLVASDPALKGDAGESAFASHLGTGFGNAVYLPEIEGCGRYTITLLGGVEVVANQLQSDKVSVGIVLTKNKENTAECQDKIYNAANFLPKDRSLSIENAQQTRLGVVEYANASVEEAAGWLAETVFGNRSRAVKNSSSNRMTLNIGNLSQSIVELTLDSSTKGEGAKNIITVVRETSGSVQKESIVEAGKIITSLGKNVNGCITRDEQTWRIISVKDVGQFTYEGCPLSNASEGGLIVRSTLTCCTLSTRSDVVSDVSYSLTPNGNDALAGLTSLDLYTVSAPVSGTNSFAKPGEKISYESAYPLAFDTQKQVYGRDVLLCGLADARIQQQANKQTIQTFATRNLDDTKAGPLKLELRTCTMDADDALAKAYSKGNGKWYATLDWDSDDARKTILQTIAEATQKDKMGNAYVSYQGQGILANDNPVYQEKLEEKKLSALGSFALSCALACGACQGAATIATLGATLPAMAWDCVTACGVGTLGGAYELYKDDAEGIPVLDETVNVVEASYGNARDFAVSVIPGSEENSVGAGAMFAGTSASAARAIVKPLVGAEKGILSGVTQLNYADPKGLVDAKDLEFLTKNSAAVAERIKANRSVIEEYLKLSVGEEEVFVRDAAGKVVGKKKIPALVEISPQQAELVAGKMKNFNEEYDSLKAGFDKLIKTYSGKPGFEKEAIEKLRDETLENVKKLSLNTEDGVRLIKSLNTPSLEAKYSTELGENIQKLTAKAAGDVSKIKVPQKWYQTKTVKTSAKFARSFVCGGVGNVAGYASYSDELSTEVENKIVLDSGSNAIIDAQTNEIVFEKGQTYSFSVTPSEGEGKSQGITIDIVPPYAQVNPAAWLDDCTSN